MNRGDESAYLTIREHFAGLAMQGLLANSEAAQGMFDVAGNMDAVFPVMARAATLYADALLAELAKPRDDKSAEAHGAETRG